MALSRNQRRRNAKVRKALAETNASNTAAYLAKASLIRDNAKALGKKANAMGTGGISWLDPTRKPLGYTRNKMRGQLGTIGRELR